MRRQPRAQRPNRPAKYMTENGAGQQTVDTGRQGSTLDVQIIPKQRSCSPMSTPPCRQALFRGGGGGAGVAAATEQTPRGSLVLGRDGTPPRPSGPLANSQLGGRGGTLCGVASLMSKFCRPRRLSCQACELCQNHLFQRLLDQAQPRVPYAPPFWGIIRIAHSNGWYWMSSPL